MGETMKKEFHDLVVDSEFQNLIPPLAEDEHRLLEDSIIANGCDSPLFVWHGIIVDGHNRYEICRKHSIPFAIVEKDFEDRDAALMWIIQTQLGRRNLTSYQKSELALRFEPLLKEQAKKRLVTSSGGNTPRPTQNSAEAGSIGETREKLAALAGVSRDTIQRVKKLADSVDDETKKKLRSGEIKINQAYTELMKQEREDKSTHLNDEEELIRLIHQGFEKASSYIKQAMKHLTMQTNTKKMRRTINGEIDFQVDHMFKIVEDRLYELGFDVWTVVDEDDT